MTVQAAYGVESAGDWRVIGAVMRPGSRRAGLVVPMRGGAMAWTSFSPVFHVEHFVLDMVVVVVDTGGGGDMSTMRRKEWAAGGQAGKVYAVLVQVRQGDS